MTTKPESWSYANATRFQDESIVTRYHLRLPYPPQTFEILASLMTDAPRIVLDIGTGRGEIARPLAAYAERVDAVDASSAMLAAGRAASGGNAPNLHWIHGRIEEVDLTPPYALATAGQSLHWMDWDKLFPLLHSWLTPNGYLAIVNRESDPPAWQTELRALYDRYSTYGNTPRPDMMELLQHATLFAQVGEARTEPLAVTQSVEDYIEGLHSYSSLARHVMTADSAAAFDAEVRALVTPYSADGLLTLHTVAHVVWGKIEK